MEYKYSERFQLRVLAVWIRRPDLVSGLVESGYFQYATHQDIAQAVTKVRGEHVKARIARLDLVEMMKVVSTGKKSDLWPLYKRAIKAIYEEKLDDLTILVGQIRAFRTACKVQENVDLVLKDQAAGRYDTALTKFAAQLRHIENNSPKDTLDYWEGHMARERWKEDREGIVATGLKLLDKAMGGGLAAGELGIIEAPPKVGKSSFLAKFAVGAMGDYKNVALATGELSAFKTRKRVDSMLTGIQYRNLFKKALEKAGTRAQMRQARKVIKGEMKIKAFPSGRAKVRDIESWLVEMKHEFNFMPDLLVVDYLMLFKPNSSFDERRHEIGQVAIDLRGLAVEYNIPVWTATQTNRAALQKDTVGASDLAEDFSLFFTLDFLLAICQSKEEKGTSKDQQEGKPEEARLYIAGARDVAQGVIIKIQLERSRFAIKELGYA